MKKYVFLLFILLELFFSIENNITTNKHKVFVKKNVDYDSSEVYFPSPENDISSEESSSYSIFDKDTSGFGDFY